MKQLRKAAPVLFVVAALAILFAVSGLAAPARSVEQAFTQPDGGVFYGTPYGDEFFHYVKTRGGALLTLGDDGVWRHAGTDARYLLDEPPAPAAEAAWIEEQLAAVQAPGYGLQPVLDGEAPGPQAVTGEQPLLVVLVDFKDVKIQREALWADLVFGETNSVKSFYADATGGAINIVPARESYTGAGAANDGVVRVSLDYDHPNSVQASAEVVKDIKEWSTVVDAVKAAAALVDFASYDRNRDMKITEDELHILVVCAGYESSCSGDFVPSVWGHYAHPGIALGSAGGRGLTSYMMIGEMHRDYGSPAHVATIGIICHELGHSLGLPDLYSNGRMLGLGGFSVMSDGNWGCLPGEDSGTTPVFLDAYSLELLGAFPVQDVAPGAGFDGALRSISTGEKSILRLRVPGSGEYFLIENRQLEMNDLAMGYYMRHNAPGGLAVYRINPRFTNNYEDGRQVAILLEADEGVIGYSRLQSGQLWGNDPFYYVSDGRPVNLNRTTSPSTRLQDGGSAWFNFLCASEPGPSMDLSVSPILTASPQFLTLDYRRGAGKITVQGTAGPATFTSGATDVATVDDDGNVRAVRGGKGWADITVSDGSAIDGLEITDTVIVNVRYAWWQWLIVILLFGWIWY